MAARTLPRMEREYKGTSAWSQGRTARHAAGHPQAGGSFGYFDLPLSNLYSIVPFRYERDMPDLESRISESALRA